MDRHEIEALLPFLANETLEGDERAEVEAAVATDPQLALELDALKAMRATLQAEEVQSPGELGLARLLRSVEGETETDLAGPAVDAPVAANTNRPIIWQAIAAALLAVVVGQVLWFNTGRDAGPGFELAGAQADAQLSVTFVPTASEAAIRMVLLDTGFEIVSGPSALGLYGLAAADGTDVPAAVAVLEASGLVESVDVIE